MLLLQPGVLVTGCVAKLLLLLLMVLMVVVGVTALWVCSVLLLQPLLTALLV
jgi:hypothetical protein